MRGQTIGKTMPHGYAGSYSGQPDMIVDSHPLEGNVAVAFGQALIYGTAGAVVPFGADGTAAKFAGIRRQRQMCIRDRGHTSRERPCLYSSVAASM